MNVYGSDASRCALIKKLPAFNGYISAVTGQGPNAFFHSPPTYLRDGHRSWLNFEFMTHTDKWTDVRNGGFEGKSTGKIIAILEFAVLLFGVLYALALFCVRILYI